MRANNIRFFRVFVQMAVVLTYAGAVPALGSNINVGKVAAIGTDCFKKCLHRRHRPSYAGRLDACGLDRVLATNLKSCLILSSLSKPPNGCASKGVVELFSQRR